MEITLSVSGNCEEEKICHLLQMRPDLPAILQPNIVGAKQWSLWFSDWVNRDENMTDTVTEKEKKEEHPMQRFNANTGSKSSHVARLKVRVWRSGWGCSMSDFNAGHWSLCPVASKICLFLSATTTSLNVLIA